MNKAFTRHVITGFLLLVFSLNTLLGFACGAGWNLGYNAGHHQQQKSAEHHSDKKVSPDHHSGNHHHEKSENKHEDNEDCCSGNVLTISLSDKSVPKSPEKPQPVFYSLFTLVDFYLFNSPGIYSTQNSSSYLIPGHHPPITDIRIAIRSFQI